MRYLDNAATTHPKPPEVIAAVTAVLLHGANPDRGASTAARNAAAVVQRAREDVAQLLGLADASRLAFTLNATDALSLALRSLVRPGARVVTTVLEHAAAARYLQRMRDTERVDLVRIPTEPDGRVDPDAVARAAGGARAADCVVMTCASNVSGVLQPWEEVASRLEPLGVPLLLDGAQAAGAVPVRFDALGPRAALAFTGHKALLGPMGIGGLLVGADLHLGPWREGGTGDSLSPLQPEAMPKRLEAGTPPLPAIAGLGAGVRWLRERLDDVRAHEAALAARLLEGLRAIPRVRVPGVPDTGPVPPRVPLVGFVMEGYRAEEIGALLDSEFGITVRAGIHCAPWAHEALGTLPDGTVRASVGPMTPDEDVTALLDAVAEIAAG